MIMLSERQFALLLLGRLEKLMMVQLLSVHVTDRIALLMNKVPRENNNENCILGMCCGFLTENVIREICRFLCFIKFRCIYTLRSA